MRSIPANAGSSRVAVLAYDGVSMFEFAVALDVFGPHEVPPLCDGWYEVMVCGESASVRMGNGLIMQVPRRLASVSSAHTVVVPPCDDAFAVSDAVLTALRAAHARGARVLSLCTGAFVLARAGLLDGRRAVTHWANCAELAEAFPAVTVDPSVLYVDDGDIATSAGSAASIDLCLHVVRVDHGAELAADLARSLVVQPHRGGGQAQYIRTPMPTTTSVNPLTSTMTWMVEHLAEPMTVMSLARRALMAPRSFTRHFVATTGTTPYRWLLGRRIAHAQQLLEATDLSVDLVAERSGLGHAANLRKHFGRHVGTSPTEYRDAFCENRSLPPDARR